jgi:hypothetical protein
MTTGYLLTCGTSLLGNLPNLEPTGLVGAVLGPALEAVAPDVRAAIPPGRKQPFTYRPTLGGVLQDFGGMRGAVMRIAAEGGVPSDVHSLGAELESIVRRMCGQEPSGAGRLRPEDPIALIVSDTPEGLTCGLLIASMTGRSIRVLTHRGGPQETVNGWDPEEHEAHPDMDVAAAPVEVYVIPNLATGTEDAISEAAPWLAGALARTVGGVLKDGYWSEVDESQAEISGGFKATLPLVHALLEYCAALGAGSRITCVLRHETAPDVWIRAGLRRLTKKELQQRLEELREVRAGRDPERRLLHGFGWRYDAVNGGLPVLTPEGLGILAFSRL